MGGLVGVYYNGYYESSSLITAHKQRPVKTYNQFSPQTLWR